MVPPSLIATSLVLQQTIAMTPMEPVSPEPSDQFSNSFKALVATGVSKWSALGILYSSHPTEALAHGLQILDQESTFKLAPSLSEIAEGSPIAAQSLLCTALMEFEFGDMNLVDCPWITALPDSMVVSGNLFVMDCSGLTRLPLGIDVKGVLYLKACEHIYQIPDDIVIGRDLQIDDCPEFTTLPHALVVHGNLSINFCNSLSALPNDLRVEEDLSIQGCPTFKDLPLGMHLGGNLEIIDCTSWSGLIPTCARIDGLIITEDHSEGISLADWREAHP